MKTSLMCMECNVSQVIKVSKLLNVSKEKQETAVKRIFKELSKVSYDKSNPEIMGEVTWKVMSEVFGNDNPYKEVKEIYNTLLMRMYSDLEQLINGSENKLDLALKMAVIGNVIDFAARHKFSKVELLDRIKKVNEIDFAIDYRESLWKKLNTCKQLLYIGDNCGEIVLDKLFIQTIKEFYPNIKVYFGVRGKPIINDVTFEDAEQVKMSEVATVISSGVAYPGTVLSKSSKEFNNIFNESEVVIAKGQGNYESLSDDKRKGLFLVLLAKCSYIANSIGVHKMDYIIKENLRGN